MGYKCDTNINFIYFTNAPINVMPEGGGDHGIGWGL